MLVNKKKKKKEMSYFFIINFKGKVFNSIANRTAIIYANLVIVAIVFRWYSNSAYLDWEANADWAIPSSLSNRKIIPVFGVKNFCDSSEGHFKNL